ncbi:uncharacterized protein LOC132567551 [Heteronotia binoei]|uniref:uncharacterized protein LOC132567551 n=1 Tax=Heteronotia binoei TaxID=13085 RepID=UPI00292D68E6|nr:uncharacterized protein LOC132567551 [Heteronotia binoei]
MAVLGDGVYNSCLPFGEAHQNLLAVILILLGFFALVDNAFKMVTWSWRTLAPFLRTMSDSCFKKGGTWLNTMKAISSSKRFWADSRLVKGRKKLPGLRFRCIIDPVKVTVQMGDSNKAKVCWPQDSKKKKTCYYSEGSSHQDTDDKKASYWCRNQQKLQASQCSSHASDTETPQPACPAGSVASWVRFSFSSPERTTEVGSSSARYGALARNHQRATGDKQRCLEVASEGTQGQRFLQHSAVSNAEQPAAHRSDHPHCNHQSSETNFIPSPILPGPRQVVYSALAFDTASRTHLNSEEHHAYPHSARGPQNRLGLEWHQHLPAAQQAEVYVYLVSPPPPSPEHNPEQPNHPFSVAQTVSGKGTLANRNSFCQCRGSSSQEPASQGSCDIHKQRKSIWERKHQQASLQPNLYFKKLPGSSGGVSLSHRGGLEVAPPTIAN